MIRSCKTALASVLLPVLFSILAASPAAASSLAEVKGRGKLVMLCFPHQESMFIRVKVEEGLDAYEGIDYELVRGFAKFLGVKLEVRPLRTTFADLVPALLRGEGDLVASSFSITPARREKVLFSAPYFAVRPVVVTRKGKAFAGPQDLAGKVGATVEGSSLHERMKALGVTRFHYVDFTRWNYDAVTGGEADFTVLDETSTWRLLPLYPDLEVAFALPGMDHYGIAVSPGSDLAGALDSYLAGLKKSGKLDDIVRRHLGEGARSGVTAAE